jgi:dCMP deaminase
MSTISRKTKIYEIDNNNIEEDKTHIDSPSLKKLKGINLDKENTLICPELKNKKRTNAIQWDDYFMAVAFLSSMRSKDPSTQVGACIVNKDHRIVGMGYNGFPRGCSDDELPWDRVASSELDTKYAYVVHAEVNAILNKNSSDVRDCTIYVALFPCNECAKIIIQSGITEVVYLSDKYSESPSMKASRRMMIMSGVSILCYYYININLSLLY